MVLIYFETSVTMGVMLMIRLQRIGRKNEAQFRVVLTDSKNSTKSGKFLEILGSYNPKGGEAIFKKDRVDHWMKNGAQTSDTVHNFLVKQGIISAKTKNVLAKKAPTKKKKEMKKA